MVSRSTRLINIGLRGATLLTRFLLVFFLARYLDPAALGYYGLFAATVGYAIYFVGLDFYTYLSREIVHAAPEQRGRMLKGQLALSVLLYLVLSPLGLWLLILYDWPLYLVYWFVPVLVLEHVNQELFRLLIALSEQLAASVLLFIRQGAWVLVMMLLMYLDGSARHLQLVMGLWVLAGVVAACLGLYKLRHLPVGGWGLAVDWQWVRKGVVVSAWFLLATLALRGIQTFDRYWLEALGGITMVAPYVLLMGIAGTLLAFLDAAVFAFAYPVLIQLHHRQDVAEGRRQVWRLLWQTVSLSAIFGLASWLALPYFLAWTGKPLYLQLAGWYPWLLLAMVLNAVGMVPHYALYALGVDKPIIHSHIFAFLAFLLTTAVAGRWLALQAVFLGLNVAFGCMLLWKSIAYIRWLRQQAAAGAIEVHADSKRELS